MHNSRATLIKKYGSEEAYKAHMRKIARKGGSAMVSKGINKYKALSTKPKRPCKFCGSLAHYPYTCPANPKVKNYRIKAKGRATLEYEKWRDEVARPYLITTFGEVCAACGGALCGNKNLDVDHIKNRGSNPHLKMDLNNVQLLGRYPCHANKTHNIK